MDRALIPALRDCIHGSADGDGPVAYQIVDKVGNNLADAAVVVVVVVARKEERCSHDRVDMHLRVHSNLYFQKRYYKDFFCIKNWYLSSMVVG